MNVWKAPSGREAQGAHSEAAAPDGLRRVARNGRRTGMSVANPGDRGTLG
jgi:hypothetical protein